MQLSGRMAIVTGAGGGLGRAHALYLASVGARVVVNDLSEASAAMVADEIVAAGGEAVALVASVTDEAAMAAMVAAEIADRQGERVPAYGFFQAEQELAAAGLAGDVAVVG